MFDTCSSLSELNKERQVLARSGADIMEVNAAYNKAKKRLMESAPSYRKIPSYTGKASDIGVYVPLPILEGRGKPNEIIVTPEGVLL